MVKSYFLIAFRNLTKRKISAVINVVGLAIGVSVCLLVYVFAVFEWSFDNFHPDRDRIYRVVEDLKPTSGKEIYSGYTYGPLKGALNGEVKGIDAVTSIYCYYAAVSVRNGENPPKIFDAEAYPSLSNIVLTDSAYFRIFKYNWIAGDPGRALNEPFKVVLTERQAGKYFDFRRGDNVIGREVTYFDDNDTIHATVSGVIADPPENSDFNYTDFLSASTARRGSRTILIGLDSWNGMMIAQTFLKIKPGTLASGIEDQLALITKEYLSAQESSKVKLLLEPLSAVHFDTQYEDGNIHKTYRPLLYILIITAGFVLLIAIINFVNLATAYSFRRSKEMSIRKVLGGSKRDLITQMLCETGLLVLLAVILSILLIYPLIRIFPGLFPDGMRADLTDPGIYLYIFILSVITVLLAAFYPALVLSSYTPTAGLKSNVPHTTGSKAFLRKALVAFQFVCSLLFIIGALLVDKQVNYLLSTDMGFSRENILNLKPDVKYYSTNKAEILSQHIMGFSGIEDVSRSLGTPLMSRNSILKIQCRQKGVNLFIRTNIVDNRFIPLYKIKIIAGRNVHAPRDGSPAEFIINKSYASVLGFSRPEDAVGTILKASWLQPMVGEVVGVVEDFHTESLHAPIAPAALISFNDISLCLSIKIAPSYISGRNFDNVISNIESAWRDVYPDKKFEYTVFDETINGFYIKERNIRATIDIVMGIAVFICCAGLLGLISYITEQRTKEIAIRKIVGASPLKIAVLIIEEFIKPLGVAIAIASPIAWYLSGRWLENFAYRIDLDAGVFIEASLVLTGIGCITIGFKTLRAALANPAESLRSE